MTSKRTMGFTALAGVAAVAAFTPFLQSSDGAPATPQPPQSPPSDRVEVVHAQRFELQAPYTHWWRKERPKVAAGWLLVLDVEPDMVRPTQNAQPVLYVGTQTAERINIGYQSGKLVVLVPGNADLTETPIFFGAPALPEQIGVTEIEADVAAAALRGVVPPEREQVFAVVQDTLRFADDHQLRLAAADLIERFAPDESDLVRGMRVPLVR